MNVTQELLRIVEGAHSSTRILDAATRVIPQRLEADGCTAFLVDDHGQLVRGAVDDAGAHTSTQETNDEMEGLAGRVAAEGHIVTTRGATASLLGAPVVTALREACAA